MESHCNSPAVYENAISKCCIKVVQNPKNHLQSTVSRFFNGMCTGAAMGSPPVSPNPLHWWNVVTTVNGTSAVLLRDEACVCIYIYIYTYLQVHRPVWRFASPASEAVERQCFAAHFLLGQRSKASWIRFSFVLVLNLCD